MLMRSEFQQSLAKLKCGMKTGMKTGKSQPKGQISISTHNDFEFQLHLVTHFQDKDAAPSTRHIRVYNLAMS